MSLGEGRKNLVSIIIPCYVLDRGGNIYPERENYQIQEHCLSNLKKYTHSEKYEFELILVDNASEDGVTQMMNHADIYVRNTENLGCSGGWNQGLKVSNGEYIVIMNNDVYIYDGWLDGIIDPLLDKNVGFSTPDVLQHLGKYGAGTPPQEYPNLNDAAQELKKPEVHFEFKKREDGWGSLFAARRELYNRIGTFDENFKFGMFEDRDMWVRAADAGYKKIRTQGCWVSHIGNATFGKLHNQQKIYSDNRDYFHSKYDDIRM
jgi:GT2 family glycosyltransferase